MVAERIGGRTVAELSDAITPTELACWDALFRVEAAEVEKERERAKVRR